MGVSSEAMLTGRGAVFEKAVGEMLLLRHHELCVTREQFAVLLNCLLKHLRVLFSETIATDKAALAAL